MNTLRSIILGAVLAVSSSTIVLGGEIQGPARTDPPPPPPSAMLTEDVTAPVQVDDYQVVLQDLLSDVLLTIYCY